MAIIAVTYVYGGDPQALTEHRPRHRDFLRELQRPYLLTMVGGGHDGAELCRIAAQAEVPDGMRHVVVAGPQMSGAERAEIEALAGPRTEVLDEVPEGLLAIRSAEAVACMPRYWPS